MPRRAAFCKSSILVVTPIAFRCLERLGVIIIIIIIIIIIFIIIIIIIIIIISGLSFEHFLVSNGSRQVRNGLVPFHLQNEFRAHLR